MISEPQRSLEAALRSPKFEVPPSQAKAVGLPSRRRERSERSAKAGAPGRIRTCGLWLRRPTLYPAELRAQPARRRDSVASAGRTSNFKLRTSNWKPGDSGSRELRWKISIQERRRRRRPPPFEVRSSQFEVPPSHSEGGWRARRDLNPRPTGSKPGALSN